MEPKQRNPEKKNQQKMVNRKLNFFAQTVEHILGYSLIDVINFLSVNF